MTGTERIGNGVAVVATILLLVSSFSKSWALGIRGESTWRVGLQSVEACTPPSTCSVLSLSAWSEQSAHSIAPMAPKALTVFRVLGALLLLASLIGAASMLALLGCRLLRRQPRWRVHPGSVALVVSLSLFVINALLIALHPFDGPGWRSGPAFMILGGANAATLAAGLLLGRTRAAKAPQHEDEWFE